MRKNLFFACSAMIIIVFLFQQFNNNDLNISKIDYRTDLEPIQERFIGLKDIKKVYWKAGTYGSRNFGLTDIWLKGYIILDQETGNSLLNEYLWDSFDLTFEKGISPDVTGFDHFDWLFSSDFTEKIKPIYYIGDLYFDKQNKVIYFDLSTY